MTKKGSARWVFDPGSGGKRIPEELKPIIKQRILDYAATHFKNQYTRLDIRFRDKFCYIDAYTEPKLVPGWPPADWPETREEYLERLRSTPIHLCRLRYYGDPDRWGFAHYAYSSESYQLSIFEDGAFFGTPEAAFHISASLYLNE